MDALCGGQTRMGQNNSCLLDFTPVYNPLTLNMAGSVTIA